MSTAALIGLALFAVALLLILVVVVRLHAFVALLATSLVVAVLGGVPLGDIAGEIQEQMGATLGYIAIVIGLGAMFGELLRRSGGASIIAARLLDALGERRAPLALAATGLIVAIPVFFDVALILLIPLVYTLARASRRSLLYYAIPMLAGIAVAHSFIPPTPGPVAVAGLLGADLGWVILFGLLAGLPATAVGGLWFGRRIAERIHIEVPESMLRSTDKEGTERAVTAETVPSRMSTSGSATRPAARPNASLVAPIVEAGDSSPTLLAALTVAIASGATVLSHVNDSGFWLVSRFLGMTEAQTLRVWTVMETLVGLTGLAVVAALSVFL